VFQFLGMSKDTISTTQRTLTHLSCSIFVNWKVYAKTKQSDGRWALFTAIEKGLNWSDGLDKILDANGAAIEDQDVVTGLEAFMLAAVVSSNPNRRYMESIYKLLRDYPPAIIPYVK